MRWKRAAYYNEHTADGFMIVAIEAGDPLEGVSQFAKASIPRQHVTIANLLLGDGWQK